MTPVMEKVNEVRSDGLHANFGLIWTDILTFRRPTSTIVDVPHR